MASGEKVDRVVVANPDWYASFPQLFRTDREVVLLFQVQELERLKAIPEHPHWQKVAQPRWAVSRDQGLSWDVTDRPPQVGRVLDATNPSCPLADGGTVTLSFDRNRPKVALIEHGTVGGYRPYQSTDLPGAEKHAFDNFGPYNEFCPFGVARTPDGAIIACGYATMPAELSGTAWTKTNTLFLQSDDEGRTWRYLSDLPNPYPFGFSEADLVAGPGDYLQVYMRADWNYVPREQWPPEADTGEERYGYFLYRSESVDGGRTWSVPEQLPLWGHPPCVKRLRSGNLLLVWGHRQPPYGAVGCISSDNGKTWDPSKAKQLIGFDPGGYDLGYPVATQFPDGRILCACYGYSTNEIYGKVPHGIFASTFDEQWLAR
ncbi:MAG: exo-alpha-sialidase [Phycisphaerae bacterium]|nr:exo-alpha-sialidase [Phycisphaerae bacterium]